MNISIKVIALVAALSTISFAAPVAAQEPLRKGEVRTLPCQSDTTVGYGAYTVRGEIVGGTGNDPIIGMKIIKVTRCTSAPVVENIPVWPSLESVLAMSRTESRVACSSDGYTVIVWKSGDQDINTSRHCRIG